MYQRLIASRLHKAISCVRLRSWTTIGVSANIIQASWQALEESLVYGLLHTES